MPELSSGISTSILLESIRLKAKKLNSFILIGHMPDLGYMSDFLLAKEKVGETNLNTSELIGIELPDDINFSVRSTYKAKIIFQFSPTAARSQP